MAKIFTTSDAEARAKKAAAEFSIASSRRQAGTITEEEYIQAYRNNERAQASLKKATKAADTITKDRDLLGVSPRVVDIRTDGKDSYRSTRKVNVSSIGDDPRFDEGGYDEYGIKWEFAENSDGTHMDTEYFDLEDNNGNYQEMVYQQGGSGAAASDANRSARSHKEDTKNYTGLRDDELPRGGGGPRP